MAIVFRARDARHERPVAIKVLLPELTASLGAERFLREIRLVGRLQHPHILPLFDSGEAEGLFYFVMPFVEGESLRARLDREKSLAPDDTMRVLRQVAEALDYAHTRGVVHRDIKPENILLAGGQALLTDFGVARVTGADPAAPRGETLTSVGVSLGTPTYMSPEQVTAEPNVDGRSDIYSLGCVAFEMLTGAPPFVGSPRAIMSQHVTADVPPLLGAREAIPKSVGDSVARALAKEPSDRYATAGEFATAYERAVVEAREPSAADRHLRAVEDKHATRQRVLVLDFANIAGAADADWLSTGIAETLTADLNHIAGITVVIHDAATRRRIDATRQGKSIDIALATEIGRVVGARWVVWGAFQKFGPRIRITSHFADVEKGTLAGGEKIDGVMDDIFALQDRIVTTLADVLRIQLTSAEVARIEQPETTNLSAYEHYARGYAAFQLFGKESVKQAAEHYRAAIALDPNYALAHVGLGVIHGPMYIATGKRAVLDEGVQLLERAIHLDPSLGEAYAWLAYMQFRQARFDASVQTARQGIDREPRGYLCWYMLGCAYFSDAVQNYRPTILAQAVPPYLRSVAMDPNYHPAQMALGAIYILRGEYGHARTLVDGAVTIEQEGAVAGRFQFLGAMVQRAVIHLGSDEQDAATRLLDAAIAHYVGADHVYAETMSAYAHTVRGCLAEWSGHLEDALRDFTEACRIADAHEHRISIGAHWVKSRSGLARVLFRLGRAEEAERMLAEARELLKTKSRFIWTWFLGGSDADALYAIASAFAALGHARDALEALGHAADAGWADIAWLRHDPAFAALRDTPEMFRVCADATARVALPPPIGSGGLE